VSSVSLVDGNSVCANADCIIGELPNIAGIGIHNNSYIHNIIIRLFF